MEKKEYSYPDLLTDVLNYFVENKRLDVTSDNVTLLYQICNDVKNGKRYLLNGYKLDGSALLYALFQNSVEMDNVTRYYASILSENIINYKDVQYCNRLSREFYETGRVNEYYRLVQSNNDYFNTLVEQFVREKIIAPIQMEQGKIAKTESKEYSDYLSEQSKETVRYLYLKSAVFQTFERHGIKQAQHALLQYINTGDSQFLSNNKYRSVLNSYDDVDIKTIFLDYIAREYTVTNKINYNQNQINNTSIEKKEIINLMLKDPKSAYKYQIPEAWYMEYINNVVNGFDEQFDNIYNDDTVYNELMKSVLAEYKNQKRQGFSR